MAFVLPLGLELDLELILGAFLWLSESLVA